MNLIFLSGKGISHFQSEVLKPFFESQDHGIAAVVIDDRPRSNHDQETKKKSETGPGRICSGHGFSVDLWKQGNL